MCIKHHSTYQHSNMVTRQLLTVFISLWPLALGFPDFQFHNFFSTRFLKETIWVVLYPWHCQNCHLYRHAKSLTICNVSLITESIYFNSFPNNPWFSCVCSLSLLKTLCEKEKLLIMSNFSFSHRVFYNFLPFSSNLKYVVWKPFDSKLCRLGKG